MNDEPTSMIAQRDAAAAPGLRDQVRQLSADADEMHGALQEAGRINCEQQAELEAARAELATLTEQLSAAEHQHGVALHHAEGRLLERTIERDRARSESAQNERQIHGCHLAIENLRANLRDVVAEREALAAQLAVLRSTDPLGRYPACSRADLAVALANVSGVLCDTGAKVPGDPKQYGLALRAYIGLLKAEAAAPPEPRGDPRDETVPPPGWEAYGPGGAYRPDYVRPLAAAWAIYDREHAPPAEPAPADGPPAYVPRCGDHVCFVPLGETWVVAYADAGRGKLSAWGWPESIVDLSDCEVVKRCTDQEHRDLVEEVLENERGDGDHRRGRVRELYGHVLAGPADGPPSPPGEDPGSLRDLLDDAFAVCYDAACCEDYGRTSRLIDEAATAKVKVYQALDEFERRLAAPRPTRDESRPPPVVPPEDPEPMWPMHEVAEALAMEGLSREYIEAALVNLLDVPGQRGYWSDVAAKVLAKADRGTPTRVAPPEDRSEPPEHYRPFPGGKAGE